MTRLAVTTALALAATLAGSQSPSPAPAPPAALEPASVEGLLAALRSAWAARDLAAYLALWELDAAQRPEEEAFARDHFGADLSDLTLQPAPAAAAARVTVGMDVFSVREPRARVEQWRITLARREDGWRIVARDLASQIDGLVHLALDPAGVRADGLTWRLEDFELEMTRGTLYMSQPEIGPTALAFVGDGEVRVAPRPAAEQEQLRIFCGKRRLVERVRRAFVRIHPADFHRVLAPGRLEPDPQAARRFGDAEKLFREHGSRAFVLDAAAAPRSPWWLFPALGDAAVTFETGRGTLTFTVSNSEPESLSLFDREKRRQICLYPSEGGSTHYSEDDDREADIVSHDLRVAFDPAREALAGEDRLHVRLLRPLATLRLRLSEALQVESVTSDEGGRHLFFRVRGYDSLMVSLGALAGRIGEMRLTVRYAGVLHPGQIDHELIQDPLASSGLGEDEFPIEPVLVYANRTPWYPQGQSEDFATARLRLEVPAGHAVVTGGRRVSARIEAGRQVSEWVLERPGRYMTAIVGRLRDHGVRQAGSVRLQTFAISRYGGAAEGQSALAASMIEFYESLYGPCPYPGLTLTLSEAYAPGGHAPPGGALVQRRPPVMRGGLRDDPAQFSAEPAFFMAHELAHQWWGHGVAAQNYRERWVSEAGAHYAAALWVRHARGEGRFRELLDQLARWALRKRDDGPIHLGHRLGHLEGDPQAFRAIVYAKGALVLHMLRGVVGDEDFFEALRYLQRERRYTKIGSRDLRAALEATSGLNLAGHFEAWVEGTAIPELRYASRATDAGLEVEVEARDLPGPVALHLRADGRGREVERVVRLEPGGGRFVLESAPPGARVELNSDRGLLAVVKRR